MLIESNVEEFKSDSIEELFFVVTDDSQGAVCGLVNVFQSKDMSKR